MLRQLMRNCMFSSACGPEARLSYAARLYGQLCHKFNGARLPFARDGGHGQNDEIDEQQLGQILPKPPISKG